MGWGVGGTADETRSALSCRSFKMGGSICHKNQKLGTAHGYEQIDRQMKCGMSLSPNITHFWKRILVHTATRVNTGHLSEISETQKTEAVLLHLYELHTLRDIRDIEMCV